MNFSAHDRSYSEEHFDLFDWKLFSEEIFIKEIRSQLRQMQISLKLWVNSPANWAL